MKNKLTDTFDYQKFENNKKLQGVIEEALSDDFEELSQDDLSNVSAAGSYDKVNPSGARLVPK